MFYKNARIFTEELRFHTGGFEVTDEGFFGQVLPDQLPADAIDLHGATVIPGLIDVHIHGAAGGDIGDGDVAGLKRMAGYLAGEGITSFLPATVSAPYDVLHKACAAARVLADTCPEGCARLLGVHLEGPYFSEEKRGAHNLIHLKAPDFEGFKRLYDSCDGLIRIADVAPELSGALDFIRRTKQLCTVSLAHTNASYEEAAAGFAAGAVLLTHLFNGMSGIHHRAPGVIPAAAENQAVRAELICDGLHVHPAAVRLAFSMFPGRIVMISDALRCCGLPDGTYLSGDQQIALSNHIAQLSDGTIAGAATNLFDGMRNAISFGIAEEDAIRAATYNPACAIGMEDQIGIITPGAMADFLVCSADYSQKTVYMGGKALSSNPIDQADAR